MRPRCPTALWRCTRLTCFFLFSNYSWQAWGIILASLSLTLPNKKLVEVCKLGGCLDSGSAKTQCSHQQHFTMLYCTLHMFSRARILKHLVEAEKSTFQGELSFQRSECTAGLTVPSFFVVF